MIPSHGDRMRRVDLSSLLIDGARNRVVAWAVDNLRRKGLENDGNNGNSSCSFLTGSLFEFLDFDPGLFENSDQCPFLELPVERNREDPPLFLDDNVA